jgi:hypothetical protein
MQNKVFIIGLVAGLAAALGLAAVFSAMAVQANAQTMLHSLGAMGPGMASMGGMSTVAGPASGMFGASASSMARNVSVTGIAITGDNQVSVSLRYTGTGAAPSVVVVALTNPSASMSMVHNAMMGAGSSTGQGMMMGGSSGGGMMGGGMSSMMMGGGTGAATAANAPSLPAWNSTQWQQWHAQMAQVAGQQQNALQAQQWQQWHTLMMQNPGMVAPGMMMGSNATSSLNAFPFQAQPALQSQTGSAVLNAGWNNGTVKVKLDGTGGGSAYNSEAIGVLVFPLVS